MRFIKSFTWFLVIAVTMFVASYFLYVRAYRNPLLTDREVTELIQKLDKAYSGNTSYEAKREVILRELLHRQNTEFAYVMLERLAEALLLAGIMIVTVEGLTHYLAEKELVRRAEESSDALRKYTEATARSFQEQADRVSENVWNAIFRRLIPDQIATEITRILRSDVCRIRPQYTITLSNSDYTDVPEGYVVVRRQLYYRLFNLTEGEVKNTISLTTRNTTVGDVTLTGRDGQKVELPRILRVEIQKEIVPMLEKDRTNFFHTISLPRMTTEAQAYEIYSEVEGLFQKTDRALYSLTAPCYGLEVQVINQAPQLLEIQENDVYLTVGTERLRKTTPGKWTCDGGLLSGIALSIPWRSLAQAKEEGASSQAPSPPTTT